MKFHEFNFDLARELEWIAEKQSILNSTGEIQNLQQVRYKNLKFSFEHFIFVNINN